MSTSQKPHDFAPAGAVSAARRADRPCAMAVLGGLALAMIFVGAGCGEQAEGRKAVSGSVSLDGVPLHDAYIQFVPMDQSARSFSGASIIDGQYRIAANRGLYPGEYRVSITMAGSAPEPELEEIPGDSEAYTPPPELIPAKFNTESQLTAKVSATGDNTFDFELTR